MVIGYRPLFHLLQMLTVSGEQAGVGSKGAGSIENRLTNKLLKWGGGINI